MALSKPPLQAIFSTYLKLLQKPKIKKNYKFSFYSTPIGLLILMAAKNLLSCPCGSF